MWFISDSKGTAYVCRIYGYYLKQPTERQIRRMERSLRKSLKLWRVEHEKLPTT